MLRTNEFPKLGKGVSYREFSKNGNFEIKRNIGKDYFTQRTLKLPQSAQNTIRKKADIFASSRLYTFASLREPQAKPEKDFVSLRKK